LNKSANTITVTYVNLQPFTSIQISNIVGLATIT